MISLEGNMISVVIPSYKNPEYLEFCIKSLIDNQTYKNEIIVVVDGFVDMYSSLMSKYEQVKWLRFEENQGLSMATNVGVFNASNERILIINEDNVAPARWDERLKEIWEPNAVFAVQQIEPTPSIFKFRCADYGKSPSTFDKTSFLTNELLMATNISTEDAYTLPIFMSKKWYMAVGGWDVTYSSPFVVDADFFMKLQLLWFLEFKRTHAVAFYHFGSRSTKMRTDEDTNWLRGEAEAANQFQYKWGIPFRRLSSNRIDLDGWRGAY